MSSIYPLFSMLSLAPTSSFFCWLPIGGKQTGPLTMGLSLICNTSILLFIPPLPSYGLFWGAPLLRSPPPVSLINLPLMVQVQNLKDLLIPGGLFLVNQSAGFNSPLLTLPPLPQPDPQPRRVDVRFLFLAQMIMIITPCYIGWIESCGLVLMNCLILLDPLLVAVTLSLIYWLRLDHNIVKSWKSVTRIVWKICLSFFGIFLEIYIW